jgi:hypothetical protein
MARKGSLMKRKRTKRQSESRGADSVSSSRGSPVTDVCGFCLGGGASQPTMAFSSIRNLQLLIILNRERK